MYKYINKHRKISPFNLLERQGGGKSTLKEWILSLFALEIVEGKPFFFFKGARHEMWRSKREILVTLLLYSWHSWQLWHRSRSYNTQQIEGGGVIHWTQTPIRLHSSPSKHLVYYFMIILTTLDKNTQFLFPFRYVNFCTVWSHDSECVVCATKTKLNYALLMAIRISGMTMMNKGTRGNWMCQVENQPSPYNMLQIPAQLSSVIVF